MNDKLINESNSLVERVNEIMNGSIVSEDLIQLKKISFQMSLFVRELERLSANQKTLRNNEYHESYNYLREKGKTVGDSDEFSKASADRKYGDRRQMEAELKGMKAVVDQIDSFCVQWNFNQKIEISYVNSGMKDL